MPLRQPELTPEQANYRTVNASKAYKFQAFPAARYHEDGRCYTVISEEDSAARCPEADGWQAKQFPPKIVIVQPEPTVAELKAQVAEMTEDRLKAEAVCAEQIAEILELRNRLEASKKKNPKAE
jgi:hypothetical protein